MLPVNRVVNVKILTSPIFPKRNGFGVLLLLGTGAYLPVRERSRAYANMTEVALDFPAGSEEYKAAAIAFSQSPRADQIRIGRRFASAVGGELVGAAPTATDAATWAAIDDGSFRVTIDGGTPLDVSPIDFTGVANLNAVASKVQTAIQAETGGTGVLVSYNGSRFTIKSPTTGPTSSVSLTSAVTPATGTHIGGLLGTDSGTATAGFAAETIAQALDAQEAYSTEWYGLHFTNGQLSTAQDFVDAAGWVQSRVKILGITSPQASLYDPTNTTDFASALKDAMYSRVFTVYDQTNNYAAVSAMMRAFAVNFNNQNSTITLMFKTLPGIQADDSINTTRANALEGKNVNYYTQFGDSPMLANGIMASGVYFDEVHGLDWLQNAIETNVFGFLYTRTTKVPQTDRGVALIVQQVEKACQEGVNNGLLAPGTWNGSEFGTLTVGQFLKQGFYVYAAPVATQNQSDREARKAPPIQVAAKGAGAIQHVDIEVTFER
jgi:hypothetical protein